jgi:hypothetical protein
MLHHNELINIEEDTILGHRSMVRRFTLHNRANHLMVSILTSGAAISSLKLENGKHEIIAQPEAGLPPSPQQTPPPFEWQSHVLGLDTLLLATNSSTTQSLMYQLTTDNELIVTGKIKGHLHFMAPYFFNLKAVSGQQQPQPLPPTLDGHSLHITSSGSSADIGEPGPPLSLTGEIPFNLTGATPCPLTSSRLDPQKPVYDAVYSCLGDVDTAIVATLSYQTRVVEVTLQPHNNSSPEIPCRLRIRIRKDGVSLMPTLMNEFRCVFKFIW